MMNYLTPSGRLRHFMPWPVSLLVLALFGLACIPHLSSASPAPRQPLVRIDIGAAASTEGTADGSLRMKTRTIDMRLWVDPCAPEARVGLSAPFLSVGTLRPGGLAAFVYRPAGAGILLLRQDGPVLVLENPAYARYRGLVIGDDFGLFALEPASQPERPAYGAWISQRGGFLSLLIAGAREPAGDGGPGWYDAPSPAADRLWAAGGIGGSSAGLDWALAGASTSGYPGPDAASGRAECRLSLGHLGLVAVASAAGPSWRAPDGAHASALRIDAEARYARRGFAATAGWRATQADGAALTSYLYRGSAEVAGTVGRLYTSGTIAPALAGGLPDITIASSWRPAFAPWASIATSWAAEAGLARRFDILADMRLSAIAGAIAGVAAGTGPGVALSGGVRFLPEGMAVKAAASVFVPVGPVVVEMGAGTADWTATGDSLVDALVYTVAAKTRLDFTSTDK